MSYLPILIILAIDLISLSALLVIGFKAIKHQPAGDE